MDAATYGYALYALSLVTVAGIYAVLTLGLNLQWGFAGMLNVGVAGFFAVGAYTSAILTAPASELHLGGYALPVPLGLVTAMALSAGLAWGVGRICLRLRADYLAIATIGIAEIVRLVIANEGWATNGARGVAQVPRPFESWPEPWNQIAFCLMVLGIVAVLYVALERAVRAPWGRTMLAIRDDETAARAVGKNVERFRMEAFVLGASLMGLGGALFAHYVKIVTPQTTDPLTTTFLVWVMLIAGGSGNNRGAILGAAVMWAIWSGTEILAGFLPSEYAVRLSYVRVFLIGLFLQIVLQRFRGGLLPEPRRPD